MQTRNIIVIGASTGGFTILKKLVGDLPSNFEASIFIVWHMASDVRGVLPQVLGQKTTMKVAHAVDGELITPNRIYIAPPDHHLLIEPGHVRVTRGPKENRFRPAVDPLFRSAANAYGPRVIGVVLSGALDDGTAGLWTIKDHGGLAVVQDPHEAEAPSMPESAMRKVEVDHVVSIDNLADLLVRLSQEHVTDAPEVPMPEDERTKLEVRISAEDSAFDKGIMNFGVLTPYTCPECHGVLSAYKNGNLTRFRCHTGHAYAADSLLVDMTENIEGNLYDAIRGIEESVMLLNFMGDHFAADNQGSLAAQYFQKANEAKTRAQNVRQVMLSHEFLSKDRLQQHAEAVDIIGNKDLPR